MAEPDITERLKAIYYNPEDEGSYGGVGRLLRRAVEAGIPGIDRAKVVRFLKDQRSYTLHKPARRTFKRNKTVASGIDVQWQADLADMQGLAHQNKGVHYLLTVIDIFSKFAWVIPVKDKSGPEMLKAFKRLFAESAPRKPQRLHTDSGKEFLNKHVKPYLRDQGIELFQTSSEMKAAVVERFNRTLKTRIWTYFSAKNTKRYIDVLPGIVKAYNHSIHRSIGMAPSDVRKEDENRIWLRLYGDRPKRAVSAMAPGQRVRVSRMKGAFDKGYLPNWTEQEYVLEGTATGDRRVYKLQNIHGDPVDGSYYAEEVQPIGTNEHRIERVIKHRTLPNGSREAFVKWKGWSDKFNTWIPTDADGHPVPGHAPQ